MAGVKGKCGGARPGAGRKPAYKDAPPPDQAEKNDAPSGAEFLRLVMAGEIIPTVPQLEAAKVLARLEASAKAAGGKKAAAVEEAAKLAKTGRFQSAAPPKLIVNNGG